MYKRLLINPLYLMAWFLTISRQLKTSIMKIDLKANELVVKAGDSKFLNGKDVVGKLIVTNQRLYFVAKDGADNNYNMEILPTEIRELMPFNSFGIIPNGLNIVNKSGDEMRFKVKNRKSWELLINKMY
jgi:hypothetical protein